MHIESRFQCFTNFYNKIRKKERTESLIQPGEVNLNEDIESELQIESHDLKNKEFGWVERFFEGKFNTFVKKARFILIIVILVWVGIATWRIFNMTGLTKSEAMYAENYDMEIAKITVENDFHLGLVDQTIVVHVQWGLKGINRDNENMWNPDDTGEAVWDDKFDMSPKQNQKLLQQFCEKAVFSNINFTILERKR